MSRSHRLLIPALAFVAIMAAATSAQRGQTIAGPDDGTGAEPNRRAAGRGRQATPAQLENVQRRIAAAMAIVEQHQSAAKAAGAPETWRQSKLEALFALSLPQLESIRSSAHSLDALAVATRSAMDDPSLIGDPSADLVYTPITPCRYVDTRGGPKVAPGAPRDFDLANNGATYGGSGACSLTQDVAAAIAMNVTITEPSAAPGFLAVKPTLAAPVTSFMNWYDAGAGVQIANSGVATVDQSLADPEFFIEVSSATHVIVDFFGVFQEPQATLLDTQYLTSQTVSVPAGADGSVTSPFCSSSYSLTGGSCIGTNVNLRLRTSQAVGFSFFCAYTNEGGTAASIRAEAICARVPGR